MTHDGLGNVHRHLVDHEKALFHFGKAQEVLVSVYGYKQPNIAKSHQGPGNVHRQLGDHEKAPFHSLKAQELFAGPQECG